MSDLLSPSSSLASWATLATDWHCFTLDNEARFYEAIRSAVAALARGGGGWEETEARLFVELAELEMTVDPWTGGRPQKSLLDWELLLSCPRVGIEDPEVVRWLRRARRVVSSRAGRDEGGVAEVSDLDAAEDTGAEFVSAAVVIATLSTVLVAFNRPDEGADPAPGRGRAAALAEVLAGLPAGEREAGFAALRGCVGADAELSVERAELGGAIERACHAAAGGLVLGAPADPSPDTPPALAWPRLLSPEGDRGTVRASRLVAAWVTRTALESSGSYPRGGTGVNSPRELAPDTLRILRAWGYPPSVGRFFIPPPSQRAVQLEAAIRAALGGEDV